MGSNCLDGLPWPGRVCAVYTVNKSHDAWPTLEEVTSYSHVIVALGLNACKLDGGQWKKEADKLVSVMEEFRAAGCRQLYVLAVPPSRSQRTSARADLFNMYVRARLNGWLHVVDMPDCLADKFGVLKKEYARKEEELMRPVRQLHLNAAGFYVVVMQIKRGIQGTNV